MLYWKRGEVWSSFNQLTNPTYPADNKATHNSSQRLGRLSFPFEWSNPPTGKISRDTAPVLIVIISMYVQRQFYASSSMHHATHVVWRVVVVKMAPTTHRLLLRMVYPVRGSSTVVRRGRFSANNASRPHRGGRTTHQRCWVSCRRVVHRNWECRLCDCSTTIAVEPSSIASIAVLFKRCCPSIGTFVTTSTASNYERCVWCGLLHRPDPGRTFADCQTLTFVKWDQLMICNKGSSAMSQIDNGISTFIKRWTILQLCNTT